MTGKRLLMLLGIGIVLVGIAWWTSRDTSNVSPLMGCKLIKNLDLNAIDEIVITAGSETSRVARTDSGWVMPSRYDYPANFENIRQFMLKLERLTIGQVADVNEAQKTELGMTAASATHVKLLAEDDVTTELLLGNIREGQRAAGPRGFGAPQGGRFVSNDGGDTVCLIAEALHEVTPRADAWLKTDLLNVAGDDLKRIEIAPQAEPAFTLVRDKEDALTLANLNKNETFDSSKRYSLQNALSRLQLKEVANPETSDAELGFSDPGRFRAWAKDGRFFDLTLSSPIGDTNDRYVRIAAGFEEPKAADTKSAEDNEETEAKPEDTTAQLKADVAALNDRLSQWTFRIQGYKADTLCTSRKSLIKEPEANAAATSEADQPQADAVPTESDAPKAATDQAATNATPAETVSAPAPEAAPQAKTKHAPPSADTDIKPEDK